MAELLGNINAQPSGVAGVEALFNKTRVAIARASDGELVAQWAPLLHIRARRHRPHRIAFAE
jgi:hypothetical protein